MSAAPKKAVVLLNLGTPDSPNAKDVGAYLREFLMDPWVIDIPWPLRWFLVNALIVPRRSQASAELYRKIWTDKGSPLLFHTIELARQLQSSLGESSRVFPCMRYGQPSVDLCLDQLASAGVTDVLVIPLYPQYSLAATESSIDWVRRRVRARGLASKLRLEFLPAFFDQAWYLDAVAEISRAPLAAAGSDRVLFSFHGLPERHIRKTEGQPGFCFSGRDGESCCDAVVSANRNCYKAQSYATARQLAARLGIASDRYDVAFQSRLNNRWIRPFSDDYYRELPARGCKRLAVLCPSFVADCLETLEEVAIRGQDEFRKHGGESVVLIPSLNSEPAWVSALQRACAPFLAS